MTLGRVLIVLCTLLAVNCERPTLSPSRKAEWQSADVNQGPALGHPEQVHLAYDGAPDKLSITWVTFSDIGNSTVQYGVSNFDNKVTASVTRFVDRGHYKIVRYIHRAFLSGIQPGKQYIYRVGSEYGWSDILYFVGLKPRPEGGYRYAIFGDMGLINPRAVGKLQQEAQDGEIDIIFHIGDFAYNLDDDNGFKGDKFMRMIEPAAGRVPYMTGVGNHEHHENFSHYINRFTMPGTKDNMFYSLDMEGVHFAMFSTEYYYFGTIDQVEMQYNWLVKDLEKANANRHNVPWIITMGHRPMYCSTDDGDECGEVFNFIRTGINGTYGLEKLFFDQGVDLEFWAHEHVYERLWPVYDTIVYKGHESAYVDPPAPVHLISGSAGCYAHTDPFISHPKKWSAFRSRDYGFGHLQVYNATHLYFEQVAAAYNNIVDSIWLIKHSHGPYTNRDLNRLKLMSYHGIHIKNKNEAYSDL